MRILNLTATEFGLLKNKSFSLDKGLTLIAGANESGKSTLQALILFLLYGFPARDQNERALRLSRDGKRAAGEMTLLWRDNTYRIHRTYLLRSLAGRTAPLEECAVTDAAGTRIDLGGKQPGEYFLGIPREIYTATALAKQSEIDAVTSADTGDAISNLLFLDAGGAGLDTATRLLDAARRALTHNRGRGGLLDTLAEERAVIEADLQDAKEQRGKLHDLRTKAADLTKELQDKERALTALKAAARAGELDALLSRFAALHAEETAEARLIAACAKKQTAKPRPDTEALTAIGKGISLWESLLAKRDRALACAAEATATQTAITQNRLYAKIEALGGANKIKESLTRFCRSANRLTLLFATLSVTGVAILSLLFTPFTNKLPVCATAGTLLLGALLSLIGKGCAKKKCRSLYRTLGIRTKGELPTILTTHRESQKQAAALAQTAQEQAAIAAALTEDIAALEKELNATANSCGIPAQNTPRDLLTLTIALAAESRDADANNTALQAELAAARAKREMLTEALDGLDESVLYRERQALGNTVPIPPDEALRRLAFLEEAKAGLSAKLLAVAREEAALSAKETDLQALESALAENKARTKEANDRLAAIRLAQEMLVCANNTLQEDLLPGITNEASHILNTLTNGRYGRLYLNKDFTVSLEADGVLYPLTTFSAGCRDAVGLSLRLALTKILTAEPLPLLFDEVTARLDNIRAAHLLEHLIHLAENGAQILLFTCHTRETAMLDGHGAPYTAIVL